MLFSLGSAAASAAGFDSVHGSGAAAVDGVRIQFAVDAGGDSTVEGVAGSLKLHFLEPGRVEIFRVDVSCLRVSGDYVIVGGAVRKGSPDASHVALLVRDNGADGDSFATVRFVAFPSEFDPCEFADSVDDFLLFSPLERGDLVVSDG